MQYHQKCGVKGRGVWILLFALYALLSANHLQAQTGTQGTASRSDSTKPKTTGIKERRPGFDLPDSLYVVHDSLRRDIDTIIRYTAKDSIVFDVTHKRMTLTNEATMNFQSRELRAFTIVLDFQQNTLTAFSDRYDSVISSSLARRRRIIRDTNRVATRGAPILTDAGTPYEGEIIVYNFKTKRGTVQLGTSTMEGGFYYGERIKQVDTKTLFVQNGRFTTCDAPVPHYYFESPKMKVVLQEQVFAQPLYLYIADVPIFALPFGVVPNKGGGRRSGIIAPNYQTTGNRGYGLTHLGYYQVFSDYFDAYAQADLFTKGGYKVESKLAFMKRYLFESPMQLLGSYGQYRENSTDPFLETWQLNFIMPNVALGEVSRFSANLDFGARNYLNAHNIDEALQQTTTSRASFSTSWEELGLSLGIDYNRHQTFGDPTNPNLRDIVTYNETSPRVNLTLQNFFPFAPSADQATGERSFWQSVSVGWSGNFSRNLDKRFNTSGRDSGYRFTENYDIIHNPSISISPKLGFFTITPSFQYSGRLFLNRIARRTVNLYSDNTLYMDDSVVVDPRYVHTFDYGLGVSTTLFGIANINAFGVKAIRHTVQPTFRLGFHPDVSDQVLATYIDPRTQKEQRFSIYEHNGGGNGFALEKKSMTLNFGLGNDFEAKVERQVTPDSTSEEKVRLLNLGLSSGYDVIQKEYSPLSIVASSQLGSVLSVSANASYDIRRFDSVLQRNTYFLPNSASVSLSGGISSSTTTDGDNFDSIRRTLEIHTPEDERSMFMGGYFPGSFSRIVFRPKWNVSYSLTYTENYGLLGTTRTFFTDLQLSFSPTTNWSLSTSAGYDFVGKQITIPNLRVHRDLHCWEMNFDYRPTGFYRGFNFEIRVKADQLRDIKLTRQESSIGNF